MANVIYAPEADDDLFGMVEYIARDKPEAAREWSRKIRETCETIATQPEMGELRPGLGVPGARSFSVGNYVIFFRATERGIEVSRVIHGSRDMRNI
ncbi:type II toxin-antitoxin system RelE/ParE family toxin [Rhodopirellula sp. P2]|uniref:type II toxin-antitoxin system RelE/ParE family toxin n=1 Tax=Rhodopirellula sp. P2 TaxID=2127060 RepID=UPI002367CCDD|nr:type II toxin-antitoxin system RelE/ParE family toxin [Rhodopirellula sp. P2]WDQ18641.1 type II toxin-antitoxin system RelE/ParE family toxin [Rhodopirellula sp. P2]